MSWFLQSGDVVEVLHGFADNSFDALACDPPYGFRFMGKSWDYDVPSVETWRECLRVLKPGAPLVAFGGSRTYHRLACGIEDAGFELRDCLMWLYAKGFPKSLNGPWGGTALKPAHEPIVLARKPLDGTMAQNVARWGVGGLAIDACRSEEGRWPANLLLDEGAAEILDAEVGPRVSGKAVRENGGGGQIMSGIGGQPYKSKPALPNLGYLDGKTNPSRFFFCSKVSTKEREAGCEGLPLRSAGEVTEREDDSAGLDNPRAGAGRTGGARNHHPTLKPISLTTWLCRLIVPPSPGVILVPFAGAGSEMIGALKAGWPHVFGIEREEEYATIARARLAHWCPESEAA